MAKSSNTLVIGAVVAVVAGAIFGLAQPSQTTTFASLMLSPNIADAGDALKGGISPDAPSPIFVLKGILESHSCLSRIVTKTNRTEESLRNLLQIKPINKELRLEITVKTTNPKEGLTILNSEIDYLGQETNRVSYNLGTQQAALLKSAIGQRQAELETAQQALKQFQQTFSSALEPEIARSRVLTLESSLATVKAKYDATLKIARGTVNLAGGYDTSEGTLTLQRHMVMDADVALREAEITMSSTSARVRYLREKAKLAHESLDKAIAVYKKAVEDNLEPSVAKVKVELLTLTIELEQARLLSKNSAEDTMHAANLRREVETLTAVLKGLRTDYEKARTSALGHAINYAVLDAPYVKEKQGQLDKIIKFGGLAFGLFVTAYLVFAAAKFLFFGPKQ